MITCKECNYICSAQNALGYHLRSHGMKYVDYVVKHEHGGVWPTCKCGKRIEHKKGGFNRFCSRSCASSGADNAMGRLKGEASPNFGKKRTPEQLKNYSEGAQKRWEKHGVQLRQMMKSPEYREAQSAAQTDANQKNPDLLDKRRSALVRFWSSNSELTKQRRKEASDRAIHLQSLGKIGPQAPFKAEWVDNPFTGNREYMHSSWETAFLKKCVEVGLPVTKAHSIRIPYVDVDGTERTYVPDFVTLRDEDRMLFEVKGQRTPTDDLKEQACREWCDEQGYELIVIGNE